jgi:hypothetical protein
LRGFNMAISFETLSPDTSKQIFHLFNNLWVIIGGIVSVIGVLWKIISFFLYLKKRYDSILERLKELENDEKLSDVERELIKQMIDDVRERHFHQVDIIEKMQDICRGRHEK